MSIQEFLRNEFHLENDEVIRRLEEDAKIEMVKRGCKLVENGEVPAYLMVLLEGVYRGYLLDEEGIDVTDCLAFRRGDIVMGCNHLGQPSIINIEMVTNGEILMIPMTTVLPLLETSPELWRLYNQFLQEGLVRHWNCKMLLLRCSAMERYQRFLEQYPGLIDVVNNKHVASFLGMTPVTLSRLRRQLRQAEEAKTGEDTSGKTCNSSVCIKQEVTS